MICILTSKEHCGGDLKSHTITSDTWTPRWQHAFLFTLRNWQSISKQFHLHFDKLLFSQMNTSQLLPNVFLWPPEHPQSSISLNLAEEWMCWVRSLLLIVIKRKITGIWPQRDTMSTTVKTNWHSGELWGILFATRLGRDDVIKSFSCCNGN